MQAIVFGILIALGLVFLAVFFNEVRKDGVRSRRYPVERITTYDDSKASISRSSERKHRAAIAFPQNVKSRRAIRVLHRSAS